MKWFHRNEQTVSLVVLGFFLAVLCVAGGASRASEAGQVIVRGFAIAVMIFLCGTRPTWTLRGIGWPLAAVAAMGAIALVQLIPLPPALWTALPGRAPFEAAVTVGPQPWRPINLTPDAGRNALLSLVVPLAVLAILSGISRSHRARVVDMALLVIVLAALLGTLQLSGGGFDNPFINETVGEAAGLFANRNHQALLLACGLPLLAAWAVHAGERRHGRMRGVMAVGAAIWLLFLTLATGSRAGIVLAALGLVAAGIVVWRTQKEALARWPHWVLPALLVGGLLAGGAIIWLGVSSDRALSLSRLLAAGDGRDLRTLSLPLLWQLTMHYFPLGSGLGSFDPVFRIAEPRWLLAPTYLNHAHNDALEVVIEAGALGALMVGFALFIWGRLAIIAWRDLRAGGVVSFAGWSVLTLIFLASLVDYPLRTPFIMAVSALAAWLAQSVKYEGKLALPS